MIAIFQRYAREAGIGVARRFRAEAEASFKRLGAMPGMGTKYDAENPAFGELRYFPLSAGFQIYLVFYRPMKDGIEVARLLHGARDIQGILSEEFGIEEEENPPENQ